MSDKLEELRKQQEEIERKIKIEELNKQKETIQKEIDELAIATTAEVLVNTTPINIKQQTYNGKVITLKDYRYYINDINQSFTNIEEAKEYIDSKSRNNSHISNTYSTLPSNYRSNTKSSTTSSKKIKFILIISVLAILSVLVYQKTELTSTNRNDTNSKPPQPKKISVKSEMITGFEYTYFNDGSCSESQNKKCLSPQKYKKMCLESEGLTKMAGGMLTTFDNVGSRLFHNGGDVDNMRVYWSDSLNNCRATITVSGIFKGTSFRRRFEGGVTSFIINNQHQLLASSTDPMQ